MIDADGQSWDLLHCVDVPNETLTFDEDFTLFAQECRKRKRVRKAGSVASLQDTLWNPPEVYVARILEAIQTGQLAISREFDATFEARGLDGVRLLLAPSTANKNGL